MPGSSLDELKSAIRYYLGDDIYNAMNCQKTRPVLFYKQHELACLEAFKVNGQGPAADVLRVWKIHIDRGGYYNEE
jgi:hypothetical protein